MRGKKNRLDLPMKAQQGSLDAQNVRKHGESATNSKEIQQKENKK
jgi:hypothetical protein